ncbi:hypothetical protein Kpol_1003p34 [Vanderwaltozyma polyspora DSM 70294]|uniref:Uncharacterized protein n=1 Tax=Vanderwaltozyma polyspora (strain ATCC 22028 / DSM 70294 / BCRC 21397 / CBS 2163 / NBRC 10782 / NRRL Y-8283 / UCD 57-17) TaxID=436907 RepID=A7TLZ2_VANPO|nr:uncharacterized protein Kpol_1003p34 [Vanderwaltozyma polyspora DSM 70294]EDO16729.1 hypothetical protein Kpol_1003p34 [Vanderwaltozyma polyspora DSM 70294]
MSSYSLLHSNSLGRTDWCLELQPLYRHGLLSSLSNGDVNLLDWNTGNCIRTVKAGNTSINRMRVLDSDYDNGSVFSVAMNDAVKVLDLRVQGNSIVAELNNEKKTPFLSLDSRHGMLACGTELSGVDAEIHIYDIRNFDKPVRMLVDSHHDDVTDIKFHPSDPNVLLSGSTDGYTNVYDLTQVEEEDALHQVINYESVHSCGWLSPKRIYTLSHMETFAIHELNNKSDELTEPKPLDFGDIRGTWDCDYVVDVYPGYIAVGKSEENNGNLKIIPFHNELLNINDSISIPNAHGDEVVRDVFISPKSQNIMYSCGEDGSVKTWKIENNSLQVPPGFWDYSTQINVLDDNIDEQNIEQSTRNISEPSIEKEKKKSKHKKSKHSKRRYKPY